jgi:spermidine synthase
MLNWQDLNSIEKPGCGSRPKAIFRYHPHMRLEKTADPKHSLVLILFFASGAMGLVYQVVWSRMMTHVFGSTAFSVGTVLAAFMSGMAIGSWYIGRLADRCANPLRLYAWLEIGIAFSALASHLALDRMDAVYPILYELVGGSIPAVALVRFLAAFVLVMVPTVLMGATLPVLCRYSVRASGQVGASLSTLYSINTLGAVSGVLLTGFLLIGRYGIHVPVFGAAIGNLLIGGIAWIASLWALKPEPQDHSLELPPNKSDAAIEEESSDALALKLVLVGLGISGFTSFAYEVYWTRSLVFVLGNSTYALTTMLSAFLTGIALGSYLVRFAMDRFRDRVAIFGWIQLVLGVLSASALPILFSINDPQAIHRSLMGISERAFPLVLTSFGVAFLVMLLPAALIGATFPLVGQQAARELRKTGASIGKVYAINTAGNVLGALLPGLLLLGWLGIQKGILAIAALNLTLGLVVLATRLLRPSQHPAWRLVLPVLLLTSVLMMANAPLHFQFPSQGEKDNFQVLYYREGPLATTKVSLDPMRGEKLMSVDGINIGGTGNTEFKQLLLAHLPRLLVDDASPELSVGLGSGMLIGESARHSGLRALTVVEIEPSVIEGAAWFREENHGVLDDSRLTVVSDDIKNFLRTTTMKYRVISADEKTVDEYASNGFSYSLEYYDLLRAHLAPGGLVAQWVPSTLPPRQYRMVLKTFARSFPYVQLWQFLPAHSLGPFNSILIGSAEPVAIDAVAIERRFVREREALKALVPYGLTSAIALIPHFIADERTIRDAVADAQLNSHVHPRYEFYGPWDYARNKHEKVVDDQAFILALKRRAYGQFFTSVAAGMPDSRKLERAFGAEFLYLEAFQRFLGGMSLTEIYRTFDSILAEAPWNDSLRARIYAQYSHIASIQADPTTRSRLMGRAAALYGDSQPRDKVIE